jgi:hypothetical protein
MKFTREGSFDSELTKRVLLIVSCTVSTKSSSKVLLRYSSKVLLRYSSKVLLRYSSKVLLRYSSKVLKGSFEKELHRLDQVLKQLDRV